MCLFHCSEKKVKLCILLLFDLLMFFFFFEEPTHVGNLEAKAINTTFVKLTWTHPADHKQTYSYEAEVVNHSGQNKSTSGNSIIFDNLLPGTNYTFRVRTKANNQTSAPSEVSSFTSKSLSDLVACCHTVELVYYFLANWILSLWL